jgi:transcriptional regulator with XRE-family HTH domain
VTKRVYSKAPAARPADDRERALIFGCLKKVLKERDLRYSDLAERLGCSEASIKYTFSRESASLEKLIQICNALEMSLLQLLQRAARADDPRLHLDDAQERLFAENPSCYLFFRALFYDRLSLDEIVERYGLTDKSVQFYQHLLVKHRLCRWGARGEIEFLVKGALDWRPGGPWMQRHFANLCHKMGAVVLEHLDDSFESFGYISLPPATQAAFFDDLAKLFAKYREVAFFQSFSHFEEQVGLGWVCLVTSHDCQLHPDEIRNV